ncbi:ABC transporter ATP-binding protein [Brevibacillus sp. SYSU BS000544]|uniref:ABC transporter ATP-binding protein n=1 Tax=Brevibacillus sp. SYSU BS000544 TaxID=3416443 RepID=UPI003CE52E66
MIRMEGIGKRYMVAWEQYVSALQDITVTIDRGEFVSVVGPSGSGKSTFLAIAGLLDRPTEGELWIDGQAMGHATEKERTYLRAEKCGFIYQFPSLVPTLTAWENIILPKTVQMRYNKEDHKRVDELLERVGLQEKRDHLPFQLSGGEQRRIALARALINRPDLLMADEPTGALDQENAEIIMQLFRDIHREGCTILMVTHDLQLAGKTERMIQIRNGKVVPE